MNMNFRVKLCWNPIELGKRIRMAFINTRGPAPALIENHFVNSPTLGPMIVAHNTQNHTARVYSLDAGMPPPKWEPLPEVREAVEESLRCLVKFHA
jgi:hypothetical protein